ncbi:MAG: tRNA (adenosine(37)-N6)-threonylcarbamoyltransferase complex ATPase subunit type 1 TsaE [Calditrichota bacterium]
MTSDYLKLVSHSPEDTFNLGFQFALKLTPGDTVALCGDLGAGKTLFAQGLCRGLGYAGPVTSPSYVHLHCYPNQPPIYHADFYLAKSPADIQDLGLDEIYDDNAIVIIEWAQLFPELLPTKCWRVEIQWNGKSENDREISILFIEITNS